MVLVPIHRVTRRLLGLFGTGLAILGLFLLLGQMRHLYHQHLKLRRLESYSRYVDDISNDLEKLQVLANKSSLSVDQLLMIIGQHSSQAKQVTMSITHNASNDSDHNTPR